jgi:nucleoside-diphosphate-sugar epimerase
MNKIKKITILGGAGFIGHNLALHLKKNGYKIQVIDNLKVNNLKSEKYVDKINGSLNQLVLKSRLNLFKKYNIKLIEADLRKKNFISLVKNFKPNYIIHLAAVSHASISNKDPEYTFENSLITLTNALSVCREIRAHLIYFSSSMVYGNFKGKIITEDANCNPIGIYGGLKLAGEIIVKSYSQIFNFPYTIIRPSALYGERCISRRVGQTFIENALKNKEIIVNGDGLEKLDFTYITDLISGVVKVIKSKKAQNQIFNITYGRGRPIKYLLNILKKKFPNVVVKFKEREKFMPIRGGLSIKKAKNILNYCPKFSIESGYPKYINWYKNFFKNNLL